jgi:zinc finger HIT domain-containing protein 1
MQLASVVKVETPCEISKYVDFEEDDFDDNYEPKQKKSKKHTTPATTTNIDNIKVNNQIKTPKVNYLTIASQPSVYPPRHFCSLCGSLSSFSCVRCGSRYCCVNCYGTHKETMCLKFGYQ